MAFLPSGAIKCSLKRQVGFPSMLRRLRTAALPLRGAPDYSTDTVSEFHAEAHRKLQVKDLPKIPTWQLERECEDSESRNRFKGGRGMLKG